MGEIINPIHVFSGFDDFILLTQMSSHFNCTEILINTIREN